jgi:Pilus formation protein N terminal region
VRAVLLAALFPAAALAWPVDGFIDADAGKEKLVKFAALEAATIDDPQVADVEVMPESGELLVVAKKKGRALVQLWAQGRSAVWRLRVGEQPLDEPAPGDAAKKACPGLDVKAQELELEVKTPACRVGLLKVLEQDRLLSRVIALTFDVKVLQAQVQEMQEALAAQKIPIQVRYEGAGLVMTGSADAQTQRRAYFELFKKSAGRLAVSDRIQVIPTAEGAAAAAPEKGKKP